MSVRAQRQRPRAMFLGFKEAEVDTFSAIFPTRWPFLRIDLAWDSLAWQEIDVVISRIGAGKFAGTNHVILFGSAASRLLIPDEMGDGAFWLQLDNAVGEEYEEPKVPMALASLQKSMALALPNVRGKRIISFDFGSKLTGAGAEARIEILGEWERLVSEGALLRARNPDAPVATVFSRTSSKYHKSPLGLAWFPNDVEDRVGCVRSVLLHWAGMDPEAFPGVADWESKSEWATRQELEIMTKLDLLREERQRALNEFLAREVQYSSELVRLQEDARLKSRRLLTEQDDELVAAVKEAFEDFGFDVKDMDAALPASASKKEDLRVSVPHTDWEALVEVKGYERSAGKANDLLQLRRHETFYALECKKQPSKLFYVVNGEFGLPPDHRRRVLQGSDDHIELFAQDGGLVVGTVDLFRLHRDLGVKISKEEARVLLMGSSGVFSYPLTLSAIQTK